jgi:integrase
LRRGRRPPARVILDEASKHRNSRDGRSLRHSADAKAKCSGSRHKQTQDAERTAARQLWKEGGWVFTKPTGEPLNPNTDYHEWKKLLWAAQVREGRLHDARHTAATVLLLSAYPNEP